MNRVLRALGLNPSASGPRTSESLATTNRLDVRRAPVFPLEDDARFIAVSLGTTPRFEEEDEIRWTTAVAYASLDIAELKNEGLLSPGRDGIHWAELIQTRAFTIAGRQGRGDAATLTSGSEVEQLTIEGLKTLIDNGFGSSSNIILVSDHMSEISRQLHRDLGYGLHEAPRVLEDIDIIKLYYVALPVGQRSDAPQTLRQLCTTLDIPSDNLRNVGNRAKCILQAMLTLAIRIAPSPATVNAASASPTSPSSPPNPETAANNQQNPTTNRPSEHQPSSQSTSSSRTPASTTQSVPEATASARAGTVQRAQPSVPSTLAASTSARRTTGDATTTTNAQPRTVVATNTATAPTQPIVTANTSTARAPTVNAAPGPGSVRPTSTVTGSAVPQNTPPRAPIDPWNQVNFTVEDRRTVDVSDDEIKDLPRRISERVAEYSRKTEEFEDVIIRQATSSGFPGLPSMTEMSERLVMGMRRTKVSFPITNFELLAEHFDEHSRVADGIWESDRASRVRTLRQNTLQLREIIELRTFVSTWYGNIPGIPRDCDVARKTKQHRAFIDMLQRVHAVMQRE